MVHQSVHFRLRDQPGASAMVWREPPQSSVITCFQRTSSRDAVCINSAHGNQQIDNHKCNMVHHLKLYSSGPLTSSFSVQRTHRRHIPNLNPTPLLHIRIVERRPQPALALRHRQPKPHQMPPHPLPSILINAPRRPILVRRPRVQHVSISKKLDIARLQNHMQRQPRRRLLESLQRVQLRRAQRGDHRVGT